MELELSCRDIVSGGGIEVIDADSLQSGMVLKFRPIIKKFLTDHQGV
jgi:hypothetical protein